MKNYISYIIAITAISGFIYIFMTIFVKDPNQLEKITKTQSISYDNSNCNIDLSLDPIKQTAKKGNEVNVKASYRNTCQFNASTANIEVDIPFCFPQIKNFEIKPSETFKDEIKCIIPKTLQSGVYDISVFANSQKNKKDGRQEIDGNFFTLVVK